VPFTDAIIVLPDRRCIVHGFFSMFTRLSMSDLCLKVYFSQDSTEAEFIILSVALFCKACRAALSQRANSNRIFVAQFNSVVPRHGSPIGLSARRI
jgi:hypothetical protein